jgi:hypothetical protein
MDNEKKKQNQKADYSGLKRMIVFAALFVVILIGGLYLKNKLAIKGGPQDTSQESFQGPAELSSAVLQDCQQSAKEILAEVDCKIKEEKFFNSVTSCRSAGYSTESSEGNFSDLSIHISECYFEQKNDRAAAVAIIDKIQKSVPEWDVFQGPISCPSKPTLSAMKESFSDTKKWTCVKAEDIGQLATKLQSMDFSFLDELVKPGELVQQGFIDSDASCPETIQAIKEILVKVAKSSFTVKEVDGGLQPEEVTSDRYLEFYGGSKKLLNLHFKIDSDGCLTFNSLLAESPEFAE